MKAEFSKYRKKLDEESTTTVHKMVFKRGLFRARVVLLDQDLALLAKKNNIRYAISASFFVHERVARKDERVGDILGQCYIDGEKQKSVPFEDPWDQERGAINIDRARIEIDNFKNIQNPIDLIQAGPLLLRDGKKIDTTAEGFALDRTRFDSDITAERHPRAAIGISEDEIVVFACDGRRSNEAGMYLEEVAGELQSLGCYSALNLDGGESVSFIYDGVRQNVPVSRVSKTANRKDRTPAPTGIIFHCEKFF